MSGRDVYGSLLLVALVAMLAWLGVTPLGLSGPAPPGAAAPRFSAARALAVVADLAAGPRPVGSPQARRARALVLARLRALGLRPQVQVATVVSRRRPRVAGTVRNVLACLPGREPGPGVLLVAHLDSVPAAPGAADDASGAAVLLEVARALAAGPRPRHDVMLLFSDGEETGLLGAQAFAQGHPWARRVGVVLAVDSPGTSSPLLMYETSPAAGVLVREYAGSGVPLFASSLMHEVVRRQDVSSDFRVFRDRGLPGLSFGMLDGPGYDHTAYDSVDRVSPRNLQHAGDTLLAVTRRLAGATLPPRPAAGLTWFPLPGGHLVVYGRRAALAVLVAGLAAAGVALALVARRRLVSPRGLLAAHLALALVALAVLLVLQVVWTGYRTAYEERVWTETGVVMSDLYRLGLVLLAAALASGGMAAALRRVGAWELAAAGLGQWAAAAVVVQASAPGAGYLLAWPLLAAAGGLGAAALIAPAGDPGVAGGGDTAAPSLAAALAAAAGAGPAVAFAASATSLLLLSAGLRHLLTALVVWLTASLLALPLARVLRTVGWWGPAALAAAAAAVLFAVGSTVAFDAEHPRFTSVIWRQEADGRAVWQVVDRLDAHTGRILTKNLRAPYRLPYVPLLGSRQVVEADAPRLDLRGPRLVVLADRAGGARRTLRLRVRPGPGEAVVAVLLESVAGRLEARLDGEPLGGGDTTLLDDTPVRWWCELHGLPSAGATLTLRCAAGRPLRLRAVGLAYGLPPALRRVVPPRPAGMLPGRIGDVTLVEATLRLPAQPSGR